MPSPRDPLGSFIWNITRFYERAHHELAGFEGGMPLHDPSTLLMFLQERTSPVVRDPRHQCRSDQVKQSSHVHVA